MEKITIKEIEKKGKLFLVKWEGGQASIAPWLEQERDFIEKDVGLGGSVSVTIEQKGDYTNITAIDMKEFTKGNVAPIPSALMSNRDELIVAQVILKGAVELVKDKKDLDLATELCNAVNELTGAYKLALANLKAL